MIHWGWLIFAFISGWTLGRHFLTAWYSGEVSKIGKLAEKIITAKDEVHEAQRDYYKTALKKIADVGESPMTASAIIAREALHWGARLEERK